MQESHSQTGLVIYDSYSEYTADNFQRVSAIIFHSIFDQPLFTYNRTKLQLKELQFALENAQLNYAIQLLALEKQVTQAFLYCISAATESRYSESGLSEYAEKL